MTRDFARKYNHRSCRCGIPDVNILAPFDSLFANNQIIGTWDFVANEASVYEDIFTA